MPVPSTPLTKLCRTCGYRLESTLDTCPVDSTRLGRERPEASVLGHYRLMQRLGTGGMGVVYRAVHEKLGRTVAIKMMHRSLVSDRTTIARFFQEARAVNTIRHPNVVDIYDFVSAGPDIYLVMEFLVGEDLHQLIYDAGGRPLPLPRTILILEQICGALQAAHGRNLIHRDLKPANVFLTRRNDRDDFVKLLDFGLAKLEHSDGRMTRDGMVLGTPEYMAPEQARGDTMDGRVDLYALGVIAYEMMTGRHLFPPGGHAEVMVRHVKEAPVPPRQWNPALPEALETVLLRCLAKKPAERPPSAMELAKELCAAIDQPFDTSGAFLTERPGPYASSTSGLGMLPASASGEAPRTFPAFAWTPVRRRLALGGVATAAAAAAVMLAWPSSPTRSGRSSLPQGGSAGWATSTGSQVGPKVDRLVKILVQSTPPGAELATKSGTKLGQTPYELWAPVGSDQRLTVHRRGYESAELSFRVDAATTKAVVLHELHGLHELPELGRAATATRLSRTPRVGPPPPQAPAATDNNGEKVLDSRNKTINPFK